MFADAHRRAFQFTQPVVPSMRRFGGKVECSLGAFVIANRDGWILTVAHLLTPYLQYEQDRHLVENFLRETEEIEADNSLDRARKRSKLKRLKRDEAWITNASYWWGADKLGVHPRATVRAARGLVDAHDRSGKLRVGDRPG